jgi:predicted permease
MESLARDFRLALRALRQSPAFTAVVVLTLALGIGANTAIFTLMDQVLLRMLPVKEPRELVLLDDPGVFQGFYFGDQTLSFPMYRELQDRSDVFAGVVGRFATSVQSSYRGSNERIAAELVSGDYFGVLGVVPSLGRAFTKDDDRNPGSHLVAMLGHGYWKRRFGSDPKVLGQTLHLNGHPMTIVGVAPPGFNGVEVGAAPDVFVPLTMKAQMTPTWDHLDNHRSRWLNVLARLKPGVTAAQAEAGANVLYRQLLQEEMALVPEWSQKFRERYAQNRLYLRPGFRGLSQLRQSASLPLLLLMGMVGLVLLIACANVANLLLARGAARQRELAIRLALGARGRDLARQLLVESVVLAFAGGVLGLLVSAWTTDLLLRVLPFEGAARTFHAEPDLRVGLFTLGVSLLTGLVFGLIPAWQTSRPAVTSTLKDEAGSVVGGGHVRFRKGLVVAQVALSLLLLFGAGLLARSLHNLRSLDPGFDEEKLLTFSVDPSLGGHSPQSALEVFRRLQEDLSAQPGAVAASMASAALMTQDIAQATVKVDGYEAKEGENLNPQINSVGSGFFQTFGVPLLAGRDFGPADVAGAPRVAIVNETFARYFFGQTSPIGRRFGFGRDKATDIEIVGLVKDSKSNNLRQEIPRYAYLPYTQGDGPDALGRMTFYVRSAQPEKAAALAIRQAVARLDPNLPVSDFKTMRAQVSESLFLERLVAGLSAAFGLLATLLAAVGLYGVMSYTVTRRTREIGIRMAIGAERSSVLWLVLKEVSMLAALGIGLGAPLALALSRFVQSQLFGLTPYDPSTLAVAMIFLALVTLGSGYLPARRATRVDPMSALRYE